MFWLVLDRLAQSAFAQLETKHGRWWLVNTVRLHHQPGKQYSAHLELRQSVFFELFFKICHLGLATRLENLLGLLVAKTTKAQELGI